MPEGVCPMCACNLKLEIMEEKDFGKIKREKGTVFNIFVVLFILLGLVWVCQKFIRAGLGRTQYTNNAQVRQHITPVDTRVQGFIREIRFGEYQSVSLGDTLVVLEDAEYLLGVASAEADLQSALVTKEAMRTTVHTTGQNIAVTDASIAETQILADNAEKDYRRYAELIQKEAVTQQQYDAMKTNYEALMAKLSQLQEQRKGQLLVQKEQTQRLEQCDAAIRLAEARLKLAKLNLSYTVITATADGVTGRKNIHAGELVQPGQTMVSIVDGAEKWIVANYKETQTSKMEPGQSVEVKVDAVPGVKFAGVIESISDATGSSYSMIPQDNAAGNFVKVEQRIPVKILFTDDNSEEDLARLRAGMNAVCRVRK